MVEMFHLVERFYLGPSDAVLIKEYGRKNSSLIFGAQFWV